MYIYIYIFIYLSVYLYIYIYLHWSKPPQNDKSTINPLFRGNKNHWWSPVPFRAEASLKPRPRSWRDSKLPRTPPRSSENRPYLQLMIFFENHGRKKSMFQTTFVEILIDSVVSSWSIATYATVRDFFTQLRAVAYIRLGMKLTS